MYCAYTITFDKKGGWNFDDDFVRNVIIFGVDISSSTNSDNPKNKFLVLREGDTFGIKYIIALTTVC